MLNQLSSKKIIVIVPISITQHSHVELILKGFDSQTLQINDIVFSFDRAGVLPDVHKAQATRQYKVHFIRSEVPEVAHRNEGSFAGATRNTAISYLDDNGIDYDMLVMIDGDCIPQPELVEGHYQACSLDIPVLSCGKRREKPYGWHDRRETIKELKNINIFRKDVIVNDFSLMKSSLISWGCNLAMNKRAVQLVRKLNNDYFNENTLYNSMFNGGWGGEDTFMGMQAWVTKVFIHVPCLGAVEHIDHPPASSEVVNNQMRVLDSAYATLKIKLIAKPLPISFFK